MGSVFSKQAVMARSPRPAHCTANPSTAAATVLHKGPVSFGDNCEWSDKPCSGNPYFPPGMAVTNRGGHGAGRRKRMVFN